MADGPGGQKCGTECARRMDRGWQYLTTAVGGGNVAATALSVDAASLVVAALSKAAEVSGSVRVCMATPLLAAALVAAALSEAERAALAALAALVT